MECTAESIITEYSLDGVTSSGETDLTVAFGTEVVLSMLPDNIELSIALPDGTVVGDNFELGNVSPENNGTYVLTSAEGCTTTLNLTVEEEEVVEEGCTPEQIIPEYRINGLWSSGQNDLTVAFGTELIFSMLPNDIDLAIELPDGTVVNDNYNLGLVSPADNGTYILTSVEGCTTTINLIVTEEPECTAEQIIPEYRLDGVWSSGQNDFTVAFGTEVLLSILPNEIGMNLQLLDGTVVGDNYNLGLVSPADSGSYILTSAEGCSTTINLTVEEEEPECAPGQIIPEYLINGIWSSGQNDLTVSYATELTFSMLPNEIDVSIELPDGSIVGDNYYLGLVTPANNGVYILTSSEGCVTTINLTVEAEQECTADQIIPEYRLDGVWSSGQNELTVDFGTEIMFSILPNTLGARVTLPDGSVVSDNFNLGAVSPANNGTYILTSSEGCQTSVELIVTQEIEAVNNSTPVSIVYPNPTVELLNIDLKAFQNEQLVLTIFNSGGQLIFDNVFNADHSSLEQINLGDLPDGLYYIILESGVKIEKHTILVGNR